MQKNVLKIRPDIDEYFLKIAKVVGQRSTCLRHNVGAVLVQQKHIISTGYNGAPAGLPDCLEVGCLRDQQNIASGTRHEVCRAVHAEQNAIIQASLQGGTTQGSTMYVTHTPCILCTKMMINAGVKRVVSFQGYPDSESKDLLKLAKIKLEVLPEPELEMGDVSERVLVVERTHFDKVGKFEGLSTAGIKKIYDNLLSGVKYAPRGEAESDISLKQIIPAFLIKSGDEYFISERLKTSDESRLHDSYLIVYAGHINPVDTAEKNGDVIERAAKRELAEELDCVIKSRKLVGFVNSELAEVSKYHLGILYVVEVEKNGCRVREPEQYRGFWVHKDELKKYFKDPDKWSKPIIHDLIMTNKI